MKKTIKNTLKQFFKILKQPEMQVLPGQLAFNMLLSLVPILAICVSIITYFISNFNLTAVIDNYLPTSLVEVIIPFVITKEGSSIFIVFFAYIIMATKAPKSIIITSNNLYKIKESNNLKINFKAIFMTIVLIILLVFMIFIPIFGNVVINTLGKFLNLSKLVWLITTIKFSVSFIFIYISIKLLYAIAPSKEIKSSTTTSGALFTTVFWIISTEIFSFYITNIASFDKLYGNFANIVILLLWVYLLSYEFVIGMAININRYNLYEKEEVE